MFFDSVRNNKRVVQIFLALITLPFAFWGVDSYVRNTGAGHDLASVGDSKITMYQFEQAARAQQERLRQTLGENFRSELMNTPETKRAVLNALIDQRLLLLEAAKGKLGANDDMLREVIAKIPALQENGQFSMARYQAALAAQSLSQAQFEAQLRQDLTLQLLLGAIGDTGMAGRAVTETMQRIRAEEREIAEFRIAPEPFSEQVKIDSEASERFYRENPKHFEVAEQARAEYVILSLGALLAQTTVSEAEIATWYESHKDRYVQSEERRASHILFVAGTDAEKAQAKAKATQVLTEVNKAPGRFSDLAKQYSQDPGSAEKGGDLGFFGRGMMVKPFEEAVFKLRENEISGVIESEFGYHVIKLTGIKPGKQRALSEVHTEIEDELKRQAAAKHFAEVAETFSNMVYEQADSLQPVADKFKLKIEQSAWLPRNPSPQMSAVLGPFANQKLLTSLFTDESLKNKRNTEAVEVAPNTLLAARVVEHRPASVKSFESVRREIEVTLKRQESAALARKHGETKLLELQQQPAADGQVSWSATRTISRSNAGQISPTALKAIFRVGVDKLPAYVGYGEGGNGSYSLYKISKVKNPELLEEGKSKALRREYSAILGQEDFAAYLAGLRGRYKIDINRSALEAKER